MTIARIVGDGTQLISRRIYHYQRWALQFIAPTAAQYGCFLFLSLPLSLKGEAIAG